MFLLDDHETTEATEDERRFPLQPVLVAVGVIVAVVLVTLTVLGFVADEPPPRMIPVEADGR